MNIENHTEIRKRMLANGFDPLANLDKHCFLKGWSTLQITEALIDSPGWARSKFKATGGRLRLLSMLDLDVNHALGDLIIEQWDTAFLHLFGADKLLERGTDASLKVAWFFRMSPSMKAVYHTPRYLAPGETDPAKAHQIEILSGAGRQAGMFGHHDIEKGSHYVWPGDSPLDTRIDELPVLSEADAGALCDLAQACFEQAGWTRVEGSTRGAHDGAEWVYDLRPDMVFETAEGVLTLDELVETAAGPEGLRLSASWHDPTSTNTTRCIARVLEGGLLVVTDFATMVKHCIEQPDVAELGSLLEDETIETAWTFTPGPNQPTIDPEEAMDAAQRRAEELIRDTVYCLSGKLPALKRTAHTTDMGRTLKQLSEDCAPFRTLYDTTTPGGRPTKKVRDPALLWLADPRRVDVLGGVMRPDKPLRETFMDDDGQQWLNLYQPPIHSAEGGSAWLLKKLIVQNAPIRAERQYFIKWLAHKFRYPAVPGCGIVSVASGRYGTGRGTMKRLFERLFGSRYVRTIDFKHFIGEDYQSQYNTFMVESLIVCVDETTTLKGSTSRTQRHDGYARIREMIEVAATQREIKFKGLNNRQMTVHCSYFIATNDHAAFEMPGNDRRLANQTSGWLYEDGHPFWAAVDASIQRPEDVAAFARFLLSVDLSGFNAYAAPPMSETKALMVDESKSPLDSALDEVLEYLKPRGPLFSMRHVLDGVRALEGVDGVEYPENWEFIIGRIVAGRGVHRVLSETGGDAKLPLGRRRYRTYAWDRQTARKWAGANGRFQRTALEKVGPLDGTFGKVFLDAIGTLGDQLDELVRGRTNPSDDVEE